VDALATAIVVSLRRAREMGDAIQARGGVGTVAGGAAPRGRDAVALLLVTAVCVAAVLV
jgi:energy-coupling factor transport system permease protein